MNKSPTPFQKMFAPKAVATKPANPKVLPNPVVEKEPLAKVEIAPPTRPPVNDYLGQDKQVCEWNEQNYMVDAGVGNTTPTGTIIKLDVSSMLPFRRIYGFSYADDGTGAGNSVIIGKMFFSKQGSLLFWLPFTNAQSGNPNLNGDAFLGGVPIVSFQPYNTSLATDGKFANTVCLMPNTNLAGMVQPDKKIYLHPTQICSECDRIEIQIQKSQAARFQHVWMGCLSMKQNAG